jgi:sugar phosphate isomerase/epimerase
MRLPPDIGISTDPWDPLPLAQALERASGFASLVEIGSYGEHSLTSRANRRAAVASGLRFTVHGPYWGLDIGSTEERERRAAVDTHLRHFEGAADVDARCYVVHPDYSPVARPRSAEVTAALQRSLGELERAQRDCPTAIALENMPDPAHSHFVASDDLRLGRLSLVLDAGHAAIAGLLPKWFEEPPPSLVHVHLHDNRGEGDVADPHLPLGAGTLDIAGTIAAARSLGVTMILEMLDETAVRRSIAHLERLGLFEDERTDPRPEADLLNA